MIITVVFKWPLILDMETMIMMMMMLLSWFFCHSSGRMFFLFREFITRITTTSSLSSYLVLLCWRNLQEHNWASISVEGRLHSWESLSPRLGCEKRWHPNWFQLKKNPHISDFLRVHCYRSSLIQMPTELGSRRETRFSLWMMWTSKTLSTLK